MQDTQAPTLNETELRKPEWAEGEWIVLADGQKWSIPKPTIRVRPRFDGAQVDLSATTTFGAAFDSMVEEIDNAESGADRIRALYRLAIALLERNYNLQPDDYGNLLEFTIGDEQGEGMLGDIYNVAVGNAPKQ